MGTANVMLVEYWRSERLIVNFGDCVTEALLGLFGYDCLSYQRAVALQKTGNFEFCLFACGTLLDADWFQRVKMKKVVWGAGAWGDRRLTLEQCRTADIRAVRGPVTAKHLELPDGIPTGDPALLLPLFAPLTRVQEAGPVYLPHFNDRGKLPVTALSSMGANSFLDVAITRADFWRQVQSIVDADFVLTSSLHGAIIAQAFHRPWALCIPPGCTQDKPFKWKDWFAYLGLEMSICRNYREGVAWWKEHGRHGKVRDLRPLLAAIPFPVKNNEAAKKLAAILETPGSEGVANQDEEPIPWGKVQGETTPAF